jgi:hypothetical protein
MSKVEVQRNYWYKVINHYNNVLNEKFMNQPLTPFTQHFMKIAFENAVNDCKRRETHPAWHVPLVLTFDLVHQRFIVEAAHPEILEII